MDIRPAFDLRNTRDDLLDDRALSKLGGVYVTLGIQQFRRAGFKDLHDRFGVDERQLGSAGKKISKLFIIVTTGLQRHVRGRHFRIERYFLRIADDDQMYTLIVQLAR